MCRNFKHDFSFTNVTEKLGACAHRVDNKVPLTEFISRVENGPVGVPDTNMFVPYTRSPAALRTLETARSVLSANRDLVDARTKNKTDIAHYVTVLQTRQQEASDAAKLDLNITTCSEDRRPVFFFLQGGTHYGTNGPQFVDQYLRPTLQRIHHYAELCHNHSVRAGRPLKYDMHFAIAGVPSVGAFNAKLYPHQSAVHGVAFHAHLESFLAKEFPQAVLLDFMSLTKQGLSPGQKTDEFHSLSDVNMIKTMIVLHTMKLKLKEQQQSRR
eukprot:gene22944-29129_t